MDNKKCETCQEKRDKEPTISSLETGHLLTKPIGYIESCFAEKNGTPRQPSVCSLSRGCLKISKRVFNNPEHSVIDLQQFSHVWILFIFHKNGRLSCKAKVQPPRLNGAKTGVFSTRSPHRPNAMGLTLAKLDKVEGGTLYLSGIDMIQGTPVIDIKPYIAAYDSPRSTHSFVEPEENKRQHEGSCDASGNLQETSSKQFNIICHSVENKVEDKAEISSSHGNVLDDHKEKVALETSEGSSLPVKESCLLQEYSSEQEGKYLNILEQRTELTNQVNAGIKDGEDRASTCDSFAPNWVAESPVPKLKVRFTPHAEMELKQFQAEFDSGGPPSFRYFHSIEEAKCAISTVLSADPRSVYRRNRCLDRLFYFSLDTMHMTCWFGDGFAEVVRIQPVSKA